MVGKLSKEETQTFTFIRGADIGNLTIPLGANRHAAFKKVTSVTEITPDISSSNSLTIDVSVDIEANLVEAFPHREIGWQEKKEIESKTEELIKEDIKNLKKALEDNNLKQAASIAHNLKGVGGGYGFEEISSLGRELEQAARKGEGNKVQALIGELENYLEKIKDIDSSLLNYMEEIKSWQI